MKLKALFLALAVAGVGASFGLTDTGRSETGTGTTTTAATTTTATTTTTASTGDCRRFELHGTLASVSASSFSVTVAKGSKAAKALAGTAATIAVTPETRVSWQGRGVMTGPNAGDSVKVEGKQCGTALSARKVEARTPKPEHAQKAEKGSDEKKQDEKHGESHK